MRKKIIKMGIIIAILTIISIGIAYFIINKSDERFVAMGSKDIATYKEISFDEYMERISNDEDFLLYLQNDFCSSCAQFKPIIDEIIQENDLLVLSIDTTEYNVFDLYEYTPTFRIYENGELLSSIDSYYEGEIFSSKANFIEYLDEYIIMPIAFEINISQLDNMILNDQDFVVYFNSSDNSSKYFNDNAFKRYLSNNIDNGKTIYIFNFDTYLHHGTTNSSWIDFANKYGLNETSEYGYTNGNFPTFQYYENGVLKDSLVIYSATLQIQDSGKYNVLQTKYSDDTSYQKEYYDYHGYYVDNSSYFEDKLNEFMFDK